MTTQGDSPLRADLRSSLVDISDMTLGVYSCMLSADSALRYSSDPDFIEIDVVTSALLVAQRVLCIGYFDTLSPSSIMDIYDHLNIIHGGIVRSRLWADE